MPVPLSIAPRQNWMTAINEDNGSGLRHIISLSPANIGTGAGNADTYTMAPEDGYLHSVEFSSIEALTASDTNYVTFLLTNLGQSGVGTTEMLSATPNNTTKATGGAALVANGRRSLALSTTLANLKVLAGDRLRLRVTGTGTLPNGLTGVAIILRFNP